MKKLNYISLLTMLLISPLLFWACGHKQNDNKPDNTADSASEKASASDKTDGVSDAVSDLDQWCDNSYRQHCVGNTVVWCGKDNGQVISLACPVADGFTCQVLKGQNFADCVKSCNNLEDTSKRCDTSTQEEGYSTLITSVCKETESGQKAIFNLQKENCSSCSDLTCHIDSGDQGTDLEPGDECTPLFKERCVDEKAYYCEGNSVRALDCGAKDKKCLIRAADTFAFCADEESTGCTEGEERHYCQEWNAITVKCVMTTAGTTYEQLSSYPCTEGCNSNSGICN